MLYWCEASFGFGTVLLCQSQKFQPLETPHIVFWCVPQQIIPINVISAI